MCFVYVCIRFQILLFHILTVLSEEQVATKLLSNGDCFIRMIEVVCAWNDFTKLIFASNTFISPNEPPMATC